MSIFSISRHTIHDLFSQNIENYQIASLKYTVITPHLRQSERNKAFGMLVAETSVNLLQIKYKSEFL